MAPPRLALCGNVFPADTPAAVHCALEGPVAEWSARLRASGYVGVPGFGLYLSAFSAREIAGSEQHLARLRSSLAAAGVEVWTANAFPFGGFHGALVKERAFLPDWRSPERLAYTCDVADVLAQLMPPDSRGSLSTCPLGYGPEARQARATIDNLRRAEDHLRRLDERTGVRLVLGIEPEPDGALERVSELGPWLVAHLYGAVPAAERRIGICWDLCHGAVVGERAEDVLSMIAACEIPVGKVQVSAALCAPELPVPGALLRLASLSADPYLHQVRGSLGDGRPAAFPDLPEYLDSPHAAALENLRVHCHVPLCRDQYGDGLRATDWRGPLQAALQAGLRDFELETYTLPVLPESFLEAEGPIGTMVAEMHACAAAMGASPLLPWGRRPPSTAGR